MHKYDTHKPIFSVDLVRNLHGRKLHNEIIFIDLFDFAGDSILQREELAFPKIVHIKQYKAKYKSIAKRHKQKQSTFL